MTKYILSLGLLFISFNLFASNLMTFEPDEPVPIDGFRNPYNLNKNELELSILRGRKHALSYPIKNTGLLVPYKAVQNFFKSTDSELDPIKKFLKDLGRNFVKMENLDDLMNWLGLHHYPESTSQHPVYNIPYPEDKKPNYRMGFTLMERNGTKGFTISCAVCHSHNLFGKKVIGLTNRFPRANHFFLKGKQALAIAPTSVFKWLTMATDEETNMFMESKENILSVNTKKPIQLGLDTSLAHVALSLARRKDDAYATKDYWAYTEPREESLGWMVSESKPGVWWNVKYKNKWLLDGSVTSGNPIFTNIIWNEIGRGSDLLQLESWLHNNKDVVMDLTNAVYHNQAPLFTDFYSAEEHFDWQNLKQGQKLYNNMCAKCHGKYLKNWDLANAKNMSFVEQLKTYKVIMPKNTKVIDVGTDKNRYKAMRSLTQLNNLAISQNNNIVIKKQKGYVPPPLEGIWARWPYFHNNSIPNLCGVLLPQSQRPKSYWAGEAVDKQKDFDSDCNGYPLGNKTPEEWKKNKEMYYNTRRRGLSNSGHDDRIFIKKGVNLLDANKRRALVQFLQTL